MKFSTPHYYPKPFGALLLTCAWLAAPQYASPQSPEYSRVAAADSGDTVAFVLVVSGRPQGVVPIPVTHIKAAVSNQLTATLTNRGFTVVPQYKVLAMMRERRVRDGRSVPRAFLNDLADSLGTQMVMISNLVIQRDRIIMAARHLDPRSAVLHDVTIAEWMVNEYESDEGSHWLDGARETAKTVGRTPVSKTVPPRSRMLMLETQAVGCSPTIALIATHVLLEHHVSHGTRDVIDPAVTNATLYAAGYSEKYIGPDARALLQTSFDCGSLIVPGFVSYAPARRPRGQLVVIDEGSGRAEPAITDFAMSLRLVDLVTGSIASGREVFLPVRVNAGWFGVPIDDTLLKRMRVATADLWSEMHNTLEDF